MLKKRIYSILAVIGLVAGSLGTFSENTLPDDILVQSFTDVPSDSWFSPYVCYLTEQGIVKGITETEFVPNGTFTVAEAAAVITRYLGLEEQAIERKEAMELLQVNGYDKWYAGYIQLLHEAGVIDVEEYGCTINGNSISIDSAELLQMPIKRYEFAALITRSFELEGTGITTSSGTNGNEFIKDGKYDESVLENYIPFINDYSSIPESYNYYVLKTYYNGIFNGDNLGNFNPHSNLTRAEMAKVISVIIDQTKRTYIDVTPKEPEKPKTYSLSDDSFIVYNGEKYLSPTKSGSILTGEVISCLTLEHKDNGAFISYKPSDFYPEGYVIEMRHYRKQNSGFHKKLEMSYTENVYSSDFKANDILLFVLSDSTTGEAVDAYEIKMTQQGITQNSHCNYNP